MINEKLGIYIWEQVKEIEKTLASKLNINHDGDDFIDVNYNFTLHQGLIKDEFIVTVVVYGEKDYQEHKFRFRSADLIFFDSICNVINDTLKDPSNFEESYYFNRGPYFLEYLNKKQK